MTHRTLVLFSFVTIALGASTKSLAAMKKYNCVQPAFGLETSIEVHDLDKLERFNFYVAKDPIKVGDYLYDSYAKDGRRVGEGGEKYYQIEVTREGSEVADFEVIHTILHCK